MIFFLNSDFVACRPCDLGLNTDLEEFFDFFCFASDLDEPWCDLDRDTEMEKVLDFFCSSVGLYE